MIHVSIQHIHFVEQRTVLRKLLLVKGRRPHQILVSKLVLVLRGLNGILHIWRIHHLLLLVIKALLYVALVLKWVLLLKHVHIWPIIEFLRHRVLIVNIIILTFIKFLKLKSLKIIISNSVGQAAHLFVC